ncbi:MAG: hypothetical protein IPI31_12220 [Bacteroidetes bacterium]|jgi:hypothetical protein|nr:hypothetical protein [Bacteroidota bacterium]
MILKQIILILRSLRFVKNNLWAKLHFLLLLSGMLMISSTSLAQTDTTQVDSIKTGVLFDYTIARVEYFVGSDIDNFIKVDTTLNHFQKFNPVRKSLFENTYLGNLGSPYYSRWFDLDREIGFDYGRHERDLYLFDIDELKYYRNNVPFTDLYYVTGSDAEQLFHITHARNIGKDINIALDFDKISSDGYYQRMKNEYTNVALTGWYKTPGGKYSVYAGGIYSQNKSDENGGINNDTLFNYPNPDLAEPFRYEAFTEWKNWQGQITQQYHFGKTKSYVIDDSTSGTYFAPSVALTHTFGLHNYFYLFEDAEIDQSFYGFIYSEADTLRDQADVDGFYNRFSVGSEKFKTISKDSLVATKFNWEIFGLQQYHELSDQSGEYIYNNLIAGASIGAKYMFDSLFNFKIKGEYDLETNDYEGNIHIKFPGLPLNPAIKFTNALYSPTVIQNHYYGFNNRWDQDLDKIQHTKLAFTLSNLTFGFKLTASYEIDKNFILYDEYGEPWNHSLNIKQIVLSQNFTLGNFHLHNVVGAQVFKKAFLFSGFELPKLLANISWYYENHLFKSALFFQTGIDAWYCSEYALSGYEFISGSWINSAGYNDPEFVNFMPVIDVFANFDIRTFRFFVKMDNVAQGLFNKGYYEAPHYPMQPRGFKLGVDWFLFY